MIQSFYVQSVAIAQIFSVSAGHSDFFWKIRCLFYRFVFHNPKTCLPCQSLSVFFSMSLCLSLSCICVMCMYIQPFYLSVCPLLFIHLWPRFPCEKTSFGQKIFPVFCRYNERCGEGRPIIGPQYYISSDQFYVSHNNQRNSFSRSV